MGYYEFGQFDYNYRSKRSFCVYKNFLGFAPNNIAISKSTMVVEDTTKIGLTWEPNLSFFTSSSSSSTKSNNNKPNQTLSAYIPNSQLVDGLFVPPSDPKKVNKMLRKQIKDTAGASWFDMAAPTITPELKRDLQLLKLRGVMDPKRHYKKSELKSKCLPKYFQVGTVIEPAIEFYNSRLTKKERKASLTDEILTDGALYKYRKRKVREIEEKNRPAGVDKWKIKGQTSRQRAKNRRH